MDKIERQIERSAQILDEAIKEYSPSYIVSMVSGGKDSAASHALAVELGVKIDFIVHGRTGCGIPETYEFVKDYYGGLGELLVADAGNAYEEYVRRKGFFGVGIQAHSFAYRILKATPFRKTISAHVRKRKHGKTILLLNGARKSESSNRHKNLKVARPDPGQTKNVWLSILHGWTIEDRDTYLASHNTPINPVSKSLCRSGECLCGTMQSKLERIEASVLYPRWGDWLDSLEADVKQEHGLGWGERFIVPTRRSRGFFPMCTDCLR